MCICVCVCCARLFVGLLCHFVASPLNCLGPQNLWSLAGCVSRVVPSRIMRNNYQRGSIGQCVSSNRPAHDTGKQNPTSNTPYPISIQFQSADSGSLAPSPAVLHLRSGLPAAHSPSWSTYLQVCFEHSDAQQNRKPPFAQEERTDRTRKTREEFR